MPTHSMRALAKKGKQQREEEQQYTRELENQARQRRQLQLQERQQQREAAGSRCVQIYTAISSQATFSAHRS